MKSPTWFSARLAELGGRVQRGEISQDTAAARLIRQTLADRPLIAGLAAAYVDRCLRNWLNRSTSAGHGSQLVLPFPDLPDRLDIAPGVFRSQGEMTRHDWLMHLHIAEARRDNAIEGARTHFAAVRHAYDTVMPLLVTPELTTAEALRRRSRAA